MSTELIRETIQGQLSVGRELSVMFNKTFDGANKQRQDEIEKSQRKEIENLLKQKIEDAEEIKVRLSQARDRQIELEQKQKGEAFNNGSGNQNDSDPEKPIDNIEFGLSVMEAVGGGGMGAMASFAAEEASKDSMKGEGGDEAQQLSQAEIEMIKADDRGDTPVNMTQKQQDALNSAKLKQAAAQTTISKEQQTVRSDAAKLSENNAELGESEGMIAGQQNIDPMDPGSVNSALRQKNNAENIRDISNESVTLQGVDKLQKEIEKRIDKIKTALNDLGEGNQEGGTDNLEDQLTKNPNSPMASFVREEIDEAREQEKRRDRQRNNDNDGPPGMSLDR